MRYQRFFPLALVLISFVACGKEQSMTQGTLSVTQIRERATWPVQIYLSKHQKNGLVIRVDPWLRIIRENDSIEWVMNDPEQLCTNWATVKKTGATAPFPGNDPGHLRGPFPANSAGAFGPINHYNIRLELNIDGVEQVITLDPDYRVDR